MEDSLIRDYQEAKNKVASLEANKIKTQAELDLKEKDLEAVILELQNLGITDLDNIDKIVEDKRKQFEEKLTDLKEKLDKCTAL